ncbi:SlyX family protein [Pandoraea soli]
MESLEARVVELEVKAAFQEDLLETLNDIVTRQEQQLDLLQKQLKALYQQMQSQGQGGTMGIHAMKSHRIIEPDRTGSNWRAGRAVARRRTRVGTD